MMLRIEMLKTMKQISRQNLYFKGFPTHDQNVENLEQELKVYFANYGELKNLKLIQRDEEVHSQTTRSHACRRIHTLNVHWLLVHDVYAASHLNPLQG